MTRHSPTFDPLRVARKVMQDNGFEVDAPAALERDLAALLLSDRIGETFDAVVTGMKDEGSFVRLLRPPAESRVVAGEKGLDVRISGAPSTGGDGSGARLLRFCRLAPDGLAREPE